MLDRFNDLAPEAAEEALLACCAAPGWAARVVAGRPYPTAADLVVAGVTAFDELGWPELQQALAAHPRIGQRPAGESTEAAWSRREQAGVQGLQRELAEVNAAYEQRFGHLFLIFANGRSAEQILEAARGRLRNDDEIERTIVRGELRKIVELRLERLVTEPPIGEPDPPAAQPEPAAAEAGPPAAEAGPPAAEATPARAEPDRAGPGDA